MGSTTEPETYTVRLLNPDGRYPLAPIIAEDFAVIAAEANAWSAVHDPQIPYDYPEGSLSWITPDEIRFFAALSLAEPHPRTNGRLRIITGSRTATMELPTSNGAVDSAELLDRSREIAAVLAASGTDLGPRVVYANPDKIDRDYTDEVLRLIRVIDPADPLLHRGLYKFLMATELLRFPQFLEEAALSAFIAREAALELLRRKLHALTGKRAKKADVLEHIRLAFPTGEPFVDVLNTDWGARVLMTHPVNEYGEYWSPPVHVEECYDALHTLTYLFRYVLLDEPWVPDEYD